MRELADVEFKDLGGTEPLRLDDTCLTQGQAQHVLDAVRDCLGPENFQNLVDPARLLALLTEKGRVVATTARLLRFALQNTDYSGHDKDVQFQAYAIYERLAKHAAEPGGTIVLEEAEWETVKKIVGDCRLLRRTLAAVPFLKQIEEAPRKEPGA